MAIQDLRSSVQSDTVPGGLSSDIAISYIAGTIEVTEKDRLKKLLFRATRGKALTYFKEFEIPPQRIKGEWVYLRKAVYIVVFQDGRQIREKITRICDSFMGQRFELPQLGGIQAKIQEVKQNIQDSKALTDRSKN